MKRGQGGGASRTGGWEGVGSRPRGRAGVERSAAWRTALLEGNEATGTGREGGEEGAAPGVDEEGSEKKLSGFDRQRADGGQSLAKGGRTMRGSDGDRCDGSASKQLRFSCSWPRPRLTAAAAAAAAGRASRRHWLVWHPPVAATATATAATAAVAAGFPALWMA